MNISELGAKEDMIDGITEGTLILEGGYINTVVQRLHLMK